jgi:DUF4097 and DUF4098 domain-containing protein YvlB
VNGPIVMRGIHSRSVEATTVNGNITFEGTLADAGHYNMSSHNGDLVLGIPETASATFNVRTYQGEFRTDLPLQGLAPESMQRGRRVSMTLGKGSADVTLETFNGGIRVRKGTAQARGRD